MPASAQDSHATPQWHLPIDRGSAKGQVSAAVYTPFLEPTYQETQVDYRDSLFERGWSKGLRVLKGQSWLLTAS